LISESKSVSKWTLVIDIDKIEEKKKELEEIVKEQNKNYTQWLTETTNEIINPFVERNLDALRAGVRFPIAANHFINLEFIRKYFLYEEKLKEPLPIIPKPPETKNGYDFYIEEVEEI
jgi:hypothetical protein